MLIFDSLICREENLKPGGFCSREELAVLQPCQTARYAGLEVVTRQMVAESFIDTFVDQNPHLGTIDQKFLRFFESGYRRFPGHGGKALQKVFQRLCGFCH